MKTSWGQYRDVFMEEATFDELLRGKFRRKDIAK